MSTKIYHAAKGPVRKINDFMRHIQTETLEMATERVKILMGAVKPEKVEELKAGKYAQWFTGREEGERDQIIRWYYVLDCLKKFNNQIERGHPFDLESGWNFFFWERYFYAWPWGSLILPTEKYLVDNLVEDYCYWNNTDRLEDVTARRWDQIHARGEDLRLSFYTVSFAPFAYKSQFYIEDKLLGHLKAKD